jgi:hypothetical protein
MMLRQGIQGIGVGDPPGLINVDHVRTLMHKGGGASWPSAWAGPDKARRAIHQALHHPMLRLIPGTASGAGALHRGERLSWSTSAKWFKSCARRSRPSAI